jgi:hypothetical protein
MTHGAVASHPRGYFSFLDVLYRLCAISFYYADEVEVTDLQLQTRSRWTFELPITRPALQRRP